MNKEGFSSSERNDNFRLEDASPQDVQTLLDIQKACQLETYIDETEGITSEDISSIDWGSSERSERMRVEIEGKSDRARTWVARNAENEIVGFCSASKTDNNGEIQRIYVLPEFQGRGLGQRLMQAASEWLGADSDVKLRVIAHNANAIKFYEHLGFKSDSDATPAPRKLPNGKSIARIEMIKPGKQES